MTKEYPMTYDEFKKRVCELFMERTKSKQELEDIKKFLKEEEGMIEGEYANACYDYDNPKYHSNQFTDEGLKHQAVRVLDMIY